MGVFKRIHDLDTITSLNDNDFLVVDVELAAGSLLLETGDKFLLETGDDLLLEGSASGFKTYKISFADLLTSILREQFLWDDSSFWDDSGTWEES